MHEAESVWERTRMAVESLAMGDGPLRERVYSAALTLTPLRSDEFPPRLRAHASGIEERVSPLEGPEGSIRATVERLSDEQLNNLARDIVYLFEGVCRHLDPIDD